MTPAQHLLRGFVFAYRWLISPILPGACRYRPTCSQYALEAIARHGAFRGTLLAAKRIGRCHPWGGWGYDPVPEDLSSSLTQSQQASMTQRQAQKKGIK